MLIGFVLVIRLDVSMVALVYILDQWAIEFFYN